MAIDLPTSVANLLTKIGEVAQPFIDEAFAQKYDNQHRERIEEFNKIMSISNDLDRSYELADFMLRLVSKSGATIRGVDSTSIEVPLDYFTALVSEVSEGIKKDQLLNKIQIKKDN